MSKIKIEKLDANEILELYQQKSQEIESASGEWLGAFGTLFGLIFWPTLIIVLVICL